MKFCGECGSPLRRDPEEAVAERRQLTVFFADVVGSTSLAGKVDPEELREFYAQYQAECAKVVQRYDGYIAQYLGDGILAYFGYPTAHEDDAVRAIRTGLEIVRSVEQITMHGERLHVRVGIHTGLVVVGEVGGGERREQLALGETPNVAARVQSDAAPDTVLITDSTARLVAGHFELEACDARPLKGVERPIPLFRVIGMSVAVTGLHAIATPEEAPLVGREREVKAIREAWAQVMSGAGRTVVVRGEAGIGKSRLLGVAKQMARHGPHELFKIFCSPYEMNNPLHPIAEMLERRCGLKDQVSADEKLRRLERFVTSRPGETVPLLASLLSIPTGGRYTESDLPPAKRRQRLLEVLADLLAQSADGSPVLVLIEDLHWADPSTLELLGMLHARAASTRLLLLISSRPDGAVPWDAAAHFREIRVAALPRDATRLLVTGVAGRKPLPEHVVHEIVERTAGIPLFIEAVTRTVLEAGVLRELSDRYELAGPLPPDLIPATVHDSLRARIDRLGPDKPVAQRASVIGREFGFELLLAVSGRDHVGLASALDHLVELNLVSSVGEPPSSTYTFTHALIQDVAYESLLRKTRQEMHGRIAEALLAKFPEMAETAPELFARHFEGAGRIVEAVDGWMKAGMQAQRRSALAECVAYLRKAIALLETFPADDPTRIQKEMDAQVALGPALMATLGWGSREVEAACNRARELCERTGNFQGLFAALWGLWTVPFVRGELDDALDAGRRVMELARTTDVKILHVTGHYAEGFTHYYRGAFAEARRHGEDQAAIFDLETEKAFANLIQVSPSVVLRSGLAMSLQLTGYPDQAKRRQRELEDLIVAIANPSVTAAGLGVALYYYFDTRDAAAVGGKAELGYSLSAEEGFQFWASAMRVYRGWAWCVTGDAAAGVAEMRSGIDGYIRTESGVYMPTFRLMLAEGLRVDGRAEAALDELNKGLEQIDRYHERYYQAELLRVRGEILLERRARTEGEASLRKAIDVARDQQARLLELRSAVALGRFLDREGRGDEARGLVRPLYDWFTEGHNSRELREARELLRSLD
jgi:class 3 adenylate cyclase/predicted ATPase